MDKTIIKFGDNEIENTNFTNIKKPFNKNIDIDKIVVSSGVSFDKRGFKYFIGYKDSKTIGPLCIFLAKMRVYRKNFDETKYITFLMKDDELLEKYNKIWEKVENNIKKEEFDSEPI